MESEGSLLHSQVPATCTYHEPAPLIIILLFTPRINQWSLSRPPPETPYTAHHSTIRATCPAHIILIDFITVQYWVRRTDH